MSDLGDYRREIDSIDEKIAALLEERMDIVKGISGAKEAQDLPVRDPAREKEKLQRLRDHCSEDAGAYVADVFEAIMARSRKLQQDLRGTARAEEIAKPLYGLLGRHLTHSYSPRIHRIIGDYAFGLFDRTPEQLDAFFGKGGFRGITVTMPYKKTVMKYCDALSETAVRCGSVNTIVKRADGTLFGDNTDYYGFRSTVLASGVEAAGAKAIVLGSGGVSGTAVQVLKDLGADPVVVISRSGGDNYGNLNRHYDARIVVNATPVGMYPNAGEAPIDIRCFRSCAAVFDLIYNPLRTRLMLDASEAGIPSFGGLRMLTAQAAKAFDLFCEEDPQLRADAGTAAQEDASPAPDPETVTEQACRQLRSEIQNYVLIGMPGCGKTTAGRRIAELTGKSFVDCDEMISRLDGRSPEEIIREDGTEVFRDLETAAIRQVLRGGPCGASGIVFATGGGCVERDENRVPLLENSLVVYLRRELEELAEEGRPVSQTDGLQAVYARRKQKYESWADIEVKS